MSGSLCGSDFILGNQVSVFNPFHYKITQILGDWDWTFIGSSRAEKPGQFDPSSGGDSYVSHFQFHMCWPQASRAERQQEITSKTQQFEMPSKSMR